MRVFVAGATGAIGRRLVPLLVDHGHEVTAMTRTAAKVAGLRAQGVEPVVIDGLDAGAVLRAVTAARPEVVVHQMTALSSMDANPRRFDRNFELTNRLRTAGTDALLTAARAAGARRLVAQSFAGWPYARERAPVKGEEDRLDPAPPRAMRPTLSAIRHLERAVAEAEHLEGLVLRYGTFYGPGSSIALGGQHVELVRRRRFPIVGRGTGVWSFVHIDDAAAATVAAVERGDPGVYNVVDDEPAPVCRWLPHLADALGAPPPRRIPLWLGRLASGEVGVSLMTQVRGASNEKAKRELGWRPRHSSWRGGFPAGLAMSHRLLTATQVHWRPSNQMGVLNADLARQLEVATMGARLWRLRPAQASTRHRHRHQVELYLLLEGLGRIRVEGDVLSLRPGDALAVEPRSIRQVFNDTSEDQLWLVVGAPPEPANTLEMSAEELRWLYPDGPHAMPRELER